MPAEVLTCDSNHVSQTIDSFLCDGDRALILDKMKSNVVRPFPNSELFHMYSIANQVKSFVADGHYIKTLCVGLDHFTLSKAFTESDIECKGILNEFVGDYLFEVFQDNGRSINSDLLDQVCAWMDMTPYAMMAMTDSIRRELHKTVDILWTCTFTGSRALASHSYEIGRTMLYDLIDHWVKNIPSSYNGTGHETMIKPRDF